MNSLFVSIIVPMYNVAPYVERCLKSLANQDIPFEHYEIICVNDGSPDNCSQIVRDLQKEIPNIILLEQENQGVSMARNNALAIAKGNYIMPIDPDDYVVPNTFKRLESLVNSQDCDVLYLGYEIFDVDQKSIWKTNYSAQNHQIFNGVEGYFQSRGHDVKDPDRSVAILYKKEILDKFNITYPKNVPYLEDGLFLSKVFSVANKVSFDNQIFYQRTTRMGSATNSKLFFSEKAIDGFIIAIDDVKYFALQNDLNQTQKELINHTIAKFVILSLSSSILSLKINEYYKILKKLNQNNIFNINTQGLRLEYNSLAKVFNINKLMFFLYFQFYIRFNK